MSSSIVSLLRVNFRRIVSAYYYSTDSALPLTRIINADVQSKSKRAKVIKNLNRENKDMFGDLLETKKKRLTNKIARKTPKIEAEGNFLEFGEIPGLPNNEENVGIFIDADAAVNVANSKISKREKGNSSEVEWILNSNSSVRIRRLDLAKIPNDIHQPIFNKLNLSTTSNEGTHRIPNTSKEETPCVEQLKANLEGGQSNSHFGEVSLIPGQVKPESDRQRQNRQVKPDSTTFNIDGIKGIREMYQHEITNSVSHDSIPQWQIDFGGDDVMSASAGFKLFPFNNPERSNFSGNEKEILAFTYPNLGDKSARLPSVTKILSATMSPEQVKILKKWEEKMIAQLGIDGFTAYKEELFTNGKLLHSNIQQFLTDRTSQDINITQGIEGHWKSLEGILGRIGSVSVLESYVSHPTLGYSGIIDCVAISGGKLVLIDWKTSEKPKPFISNTYDTPLQIAAYIGALNYDPQYQFGVSEGMAVIAYKDGRESQVFHISASDIGKYWKRWMKRLKMFQSSVEV